MKLEINNSDRLVALYLALQPIPPSLVDSAASWQHKIIAQLLKNPHLAAYPPAPEYQRRAWKTIVAALEENDVEVDDEIYSYLVRLMSVPPGTGPPATSYLTYLLPCPDPPSVSPAWRRPLGVDTFSPDRRPITILESRTTIERGTTGLRTWRASLDLAEWIFENSYPQHAQVRALDWTDSVDPGRTAHVHAVLDEFDADVVLAADVVYDPSIIPQLTRTLRLALDRPGPDNLPTKRVAYVALTLRREETFAEFIQNAAKEQERLVIEFVEMRLPPRRDRVFCGGGGDDSCLSSLDGGTSAGPGPVDAKLMRLTVLHS
ncbi:hypothetical protein FRC06_005236 [Ceratobasidium sp. 370]|nr:hypothetical protein FRC06_005236 [Ceratobasidium sp. 370]